MKSLRVAVTAVFLLVKTELLIFYINNCSEFFIVFLIQWLYHSMQTKDLKIFLNFLLNCCIF